MKLKFKNPPINEVVLGVYFDREIVELKLEHVGLFWSLLRDRYPTVEQHPPVTPPLPFGSQFNTESSAEYFPMPRFWLKAADDRMLVQIQRNAFLQNWRRREGRYPHYDAVKACFDSNFDEFVGFLSRELSVSPNVQLAELTYVNVIEACEYWQNPGDTAKVIPGFSLPIAVEGAEPHKTDFNQVTYQSVRDDLGIRITIRSGRRAQEPDTALIFELRALGLLGGASKADADEWFIEAHEVIGETFLRLTNPEIQQKYWQPE
ncbi:unnamed protein product [Phaeothamnion confervicola]